MNGGKITSRKVRGRAFKAAGVATAALSLLALNGTSAQSAPTPPPARVSAYINNDGGLNANVTAPSNCATPDRVDTQVLTNNVHIDACAFKANGSNYGGKMTFETRGVGSIVACPDPDGGVLPSTGTGTITGTRCVQSSHQDLGVIGVADKPGDFEYHVRVNNNQRPGQQRVTFCFDPDQDGCSDEVVRSQTVIGWTSS